MNSLINAIKLHWKGLIPYGKSYLFLIIAIAAAVRKVSIISFHYIAWNDSLLNKIILSYILTIAILVTIWCAVGTYRYLINRVGSAFALLGFILFLIYGLLTLRTYHSIILYATS